MTDHTGPRVEQEGAPLLGCAIFAPGLRRHPGASCDGGGRRRFVGLRPPGRRSVGHSIGGQWKEIPSFEMSVEGRPIGVMATAPAKTVATSVSGAARRSA